MSFHPSQPNGGITPSAENKVSNTNQPASASSGLTLRFNRPTTTTPANSPPRTLAYASQAVGSPSASGSSSHRGESGSDKRRRLEPPVAIPPYASVPPPALARPSTPPRPSSSTEVATPVNNSKMARSQADRKGGSRAETKRKPTFTSVLSFHRPEGAPSAQAAAAVDDKELSRASRRSKVQAMSKLDRAGTPGSSTSGGGAGGTSFVPSKSALPADNAPGPSRNPLHRAPIINPPFDISTVRTTAPRHPPSRSSTRLFGLKEAPTYYPTAEEFADPLAYVASLPAEARDAGICKVVPPEGWKMPFSVQSDTFRFKTRLQRLNQLEAASRAKVNFLEQLTMFHMQQGDSTATIPVIDRRPLDVWRLRKEVTKMGGYDNVTAIKGWEKVTEIMGYVGWAAEFKLAYAQIVLPFERYTARAKTASVSPLTPLSTMKSGAQKPPGWTMSTPGSPTSAGTKSKPGRMGAVKASGSGKAKGGRMSGVSVRPKRGASPPMPTSVSLPEVKMLDFANGRASTSHSSTPQPQEPATAGPRLRIPGFSDREGTDSDLSDDSLSPPPPPAIKLPPEEPYQKGEVCEVCRKGNQADKILLCDGCDRGELLRRTAIAITADV